MASSPMFGAGNRNGQKSIAINLYDYVCDALTELGAVVQEVAPSVIEVLCPDALAEELGSEAYFCCAFDTEAAAETPGATLITFGDPLLDRLHELMLGVGQVQRRYVWVRNIRVPPDLEARLQRAIHFNGCRPLTLVGAQPVWFSVLWNDLFLRLHGEEGALRVLSICVDLFSGAVAPHWERPLTRESGLSVTDLNALSSDVTDMAAGMPMAPIVHRSRVLETVAAEASRLLGAAVAEREAALAPIKLAELERLHHYYDGIARDLAVRSKRVAGDPEKLAGLNARLQASELERQRRQADLEERFQVRGEWEPDQLTWYLVPGILAEVRVQQRQDIRTVSLAYNLLTHEPEQPVCMLCGTRTGTPALRPGPDGSAAIVCLDCHKR